MEEAKTQPGDLLDNSVHVNVEMMVQTLTEVPMFAEAIDSGKLMIAGAYYDLETGIVEVVVL